MELPEHFEPALYAVALDQMSGALRKEAAALGTSPEAHALNVVATELYKIALAMDGLALRRFRTSAGVGARPTDGAP